MPAVPFSPYLLLLGFVVVGAVLVIWDYRRVCRRWDRRRGR
jgi:hypothetical protein